MFRLIRHKAPFVLLSVNLLIALWFNYELFFIHDGYINKFINEEHSLYKEYSNYFGDLIGYSIATNLFMLSVYMNNRYCDATKVAVLGLIALNMFSLISHQMSGYNVGYDAYMIIIILAISVAFKLRPKRIKE